MRIYKDIDKLEKTKLEISNKSKKTDVFLPFALIAFFSLLLEMLLRLTIMRKIP